MEEFGFIEKNNDGTYNISLKGSLVPEVKGINAIILSELIAEGMFFDLDPKELIGIIGSLSTTQIKHDQSRIKPKQKQAKENTKLNSAFAKTEQLCQKLNNLQSINLDPDSIAENVSISQDYAKYIMQWAEESEDNSTQWRDIITEMEHQQLIKFEGDFFKSVKNTINILKQVQELSIKAANQTKGLESSCHKNTATKAKQAIELLNKSPVIDDLMS